MGKTQPAFRHHLHQVPEAELVAEVPADTHNDHLAVKVPPRKQLFHTPQLTQSQSSAS